MAIDFLIIDHSGDGTYRYNTGDILNLYPSPALPLPTINSTSPFRLIRVITDRTVADVAGYLAPKPGVGNNAKRRLYYIDRAKMSAADLATWDARRCIEVPEATAISWISSK